MSGHNKWSTIKHRKGAQDAKRAKIFSKVIKEITVAAKLGGIQVDANSRLRTALVWAKTVNMPADTIQKAIKKGSGEGKGDNYESVTYEGYGPNNMAVVIECLTDNKNRTIASIRAIFNKNNGSLGSTNSVQYMFSRKGIIEVAKESIAEDELTEILLDTEAEDILANGKNFYEIHTDPKYFFEVQNCLQEKNIPIVNAEIALVTRDKLLITESEKARQSIKFIDVIEDDDDVQKIYSNIEIDASIISAIDD